MAGFGLFKRLVGGGDRRHHVPRVRAAPSTRVLVVDDSATIRAVLGKMLNQDGYEVLKAADGVSALALARSEHVDLVFLDIVLPGVSGFEVLRTLRREPATAHVPIVMISGNVQATEQFYVQRYGADDFMKKPFGREEVFERVRQLVQAGRLKGRVETAPVPVAVEDVVSPPGGVSQDEWDAIPDIALPDAAYGEHKPHDLQGLHELHAAVSSPAPHLPEVPVALALPVTHESPAEHALPAAHESPAAHEPHGLHGGMLPPAHDLHAVDVPPVAQIAVPLPAPAPAPQAAPASHAPEVAHAMPAVPMPQSVPLIASEPLQASLLLPEPPLPAPQAAVVPHAPVVVASPAPAPVIHAPAPAPAAPVHAAHGMSAATQSALAWLTSRARVLAPSHAKTPVPVAEAAHPVEAAHVAKDDGAPPRDGA